MIKICEFCGNEFKVTIRVTRTKYCSQYCRDRKSLTRPERKEYEKQYREINNDKIKQSKKRCYENKREHYIQKTRENTLKNPNTPFKRYRGLYYKGKKIYFDFHIRCGVCNLCRAVEKIDTYSTQRHHDNDIYFDEDPLKNTLEICVSCHAKETFNTKEK